jgi:site-specific DNA-methyltransferase (adenine-specific)
MNKALFSSKSDEWATPQYLFDELNKEFHFDIDACATDENHKCDVYYTKEQDGLKMEWGGYVVFCNPPYSKIGEWVKKAYYEGRKDNTVVVLLIPSRTDTRWFHNYILHRAEIRFISGRLKFGDAVNSAPFPSMVVIFRGAMTKRRKENEKV